MVCVVLKDAVSYSVAEAGQKQIPYLEMLRDIDVFMEGPL